MFLVVNQIEMIIVLTTIITIGNFFLSMILL